MKDKYFIGIFATIIVLGIFFFIILTISPKPVVTESETIPTKFIIDSLEIKRNNEIRKKEQERRDSCFISEIKQRISIKYYSSAPNSAGGVDFHLSYKNLSNKEIKYFYITLGFLNAVGDFVDSEIGGRSVFRCKDTGPIKFHQYGGGTWENVIYNYSAKYPDIFEIEIEYMDGSTFKIPTNFIKYVPGYKKRK